MELSSTQRILKWILPASWFQKLMLESKQWQFDCGCGKTSSIWEIGGLRAGNKSNRTSMIKCPGCKKTGMQKMYKQTGQ